MIGYGRASETERVLVVDDGLIIRRQLEIQSKPLGKLSGDMLAKNHVGNGRVGIFQLSGLGGFYKYIQLYFTIYYPKLLKEYVTNDIII
jgi:hypothetical protein